MQYNTNQDQRETNNGIYQLLIYIPQKKSIKIGKKGTFNFLRGYYVYTGSGRNGLKSRIQRHLRKKKRKFWHIDYLLLYSRIKDVIIHVQKSECYWNSRLFKFKESKILVNGFGSSDCKCKTHLLYFRKKPELNSL